MRPLPTYPMSEAKEKDRILAQIKAFKPHNEIEGLNKHLYDLERDEYVSAVRDEQGDLIVVRLTPLGKNFLDNGGYSKRIHSIKPKVKKSILWLRKEIWGLIMAILAAVIAALLIQKL